MTATRRGAEDDSPQTRNGDADNGSSTATQSLLGTTAANEHCNVCGAPMAVDQRYCVECGTRRGKPRFSLQPTLPAMQAATPAPAPSGGGPRRSTWTPSATLLAGIATLLLALGVGVLIGEAGSSTPKNNGIHVTVNGGGGGGTSSAGNTGTSSSTPASSSTGSTTGSSKTKSKTKSTKTSSAAAKAKAKAITPPASSGVPSSVTKTPTVKPGGSCTGGQSTGCQNGKETGNFFGG
jgi:hypothetical protein